jgi:hypothetical protein
MDIRMQRCHYLLPSSGSWWQEAEELASIDSNASRDLAFARSTPQTGNSYEGTKLDSEDLNQVNDSLGSVIDNG